MTVSAGGTVVLLGDSILDNRAYTGGGPDVVTQLQAALRQGGAPSWPRSTARPRRTSRCSCRSCRRMRPCWW